MQTQDILQQKQRGIIQQHKQVSQTLKNIVQAQILQRNQRRIIQQRLKISQQLKNIMHNLRTSNNNINEES